MTSVPPSHNDLHALLWQGYHVPDSPKIFAQITQDRLDDITTVLNDLLDLWTLARIDAKEKTQALQVNYGTDFVIGDVWRTGMIGAGTTFCDPEGYRIYLDGDKSLHEEISKMCAAEAMITIAKRFQDCIKHLSDDDPDVALYAFNQSVFDFAGPVDHTNLAYDFVNRKVLPWIESHGVGAYHLPTLRDADIVHETIMEDFKLDFSRVDECFDPDHVLGTKAYQCTMCVLNVVLTELRAEWDPANMVPPGSPSPSPPPVPAPLPISAPPRGRGQGRGHGAGRGIGAGVGTGRGRGRGRRAASAAAIAAANAAVAIGAIPAAVPAAGPAPAAVSAAVAATAPVVPPAPAPAPVQGPGTNAFAATLQYIASLNTAPVPPAIAMTMPTFAQYRAQNNTHTPPTTAPDLTPAAIYSRATLFTYDQKPEDLAATGGFRWLCNQLLPTGIPCDRAISRKADLVRHIRLQHGGVVITRDSANDWAQLGPFNRLEMGVLRPWKTFNLSAASDPAHMR